MTTTTAFAAAAPVRFFNADALVALLQRLLETRRQALLRAPVQAEAQAATQTRTQTHTQTQRDAAARAQAAQAWRSTAGDCSMTCWRSSFGV